MENDILRQILEELKGLSGRVGSLEESNQVIKEAVLKLELVEMPKIRLALDGFTTNSESLDRHESRITALEDMTERHAIEITVLKQAK